MRANVLKSIWQSGGCVLNGWLHLPDSIAAEAMAHSGWDSLTIDLQHGVVDYGAALHMLQAISTTAVVPLVRVPWNEPGIMMKMLDAGCYGVICPMINSRAECEAFVGACRYPPAGYRSYGPVRATLYAGEDYAAHANQTITTIAMIETREAVDNLAEILATPGLDAIYIGPADLAQSYGLAPRLDPEADEVVSLIYHVAGMARERGIVAGMHTGSAAYARRMAEAGMQFLTIGSDLRLMAAAAKQATGAFRSGAAVEKQSGY